ncbi:MAG: DUF1156 domain-containing protein [Pseudomonadota bacterium]
MIHPIKSPRKLIEVALPLDAISVGCQQEKNPFLKGHPRGIHLWWARRPIAAARAVLFAQLVNDPGYQQGGGFKYGKNKKEAAEERKRLFGIIEDLVKWENTTNEEVLERARAEIRRSWREVCELNKEHPQATDLFNPDSMPAFHDPFAGGGAIPLEAQRLGLKSYASDLNPVAVLINKAMIEIPPKFSGRAPVGPEPETKRGKKLAFTQSWPGASGLAEDVRRYSAWMRAEAAKRMSSFYPKASVTKDMITKRPDLSRMDGQEFDVIAWIWVRTVHSPNPAFTHVEVPLASTFVLSTKGKHNAFVQPLIQRDSYRLVVKVGDLPPEAENGTKATEKGAEFRCLLSGSPISADYIRSEGKAGRIGFKLMAVVADGSPGRLYLSPSTEDETVAHSAAPNWQPDIEFFVDALGFRIGKYGLTRWSHLFTPRQLLALSSLCELVGKARTLVEQDAQASGWSADQTPLESGGTGSRAYADAIAVYLAAGVSHFARYSCVRCGWNKTNENVAQAFGRQVLNMVWDFAEANPICGSLSVEATTKWVADALRTMVSSDGSTAFQADARTLAPSTPRIFSTDPPYYDNIGYADLSDFFYVWLRHALRTVLPTVFTTITVPKAEELVATPRRHGGKLAAEAFFLNGMTEAIENLAMGTHPSFPVTIYYAFKQAETDAEAGTVSTGWETFLSAVLKADFQLTGTWPVRTERTQGLKGKLNSLASCVVLVCRKRPTDAATTSRREFIRELNGVLPEALDEMTKGAGGEHSPVAPVDLSQAIIGPGMAVFSKYAAVLEADGSPMSVRTALQLINRFLAEDDFDADTQFCLHWFEQNGWKEGRFGDADTLSRAKGTSVTGVENAGVVESGGGSVRLRKWSEYPTDWDPKTDTRNPVWETLHHLIRALKQEGETGAGRLLAVVQGKGEATRQLAYRLYTLCERQGWAEDARAYNELITSWTGIESAAGPVTTNEQLNLFDN